MGPEDFERFAVAVLKVIYGGRGVQILHTPYGHDEGRDAEGIFLLEESLPADLQVRIKLWIEAKLRGTNIGPYAVGRHLFAAFCRDVTKIIFVTNRDFTSNVRQSIHAFCSKANIQFGLVSGRKLLEFAECSTNARADQRVTYRAISRARKDPLSIEASGQVGRNLHTTAHSALTEVVAVGAPLFLSADVTISGTGEFGEISIRDDSPESPTLRIVPYGRVSKGPFRDADTVRLRYSVTADGPGTLDISRFSISADDQRFALVRDDSRRSAITVERPIFGSFAFPTQTDQIVTARLAVDGWVKAPKFAFVILSAAAGLGKTHLVDELRCSWLCEGIEELLLDGAEVRNEAGLVEALFNYVFPLPPEKLGEARQDTLRDWLRDAGLSIGRASDVARAIIAGQVDGNASPHLLADVARALISSVSRERPFALVFEDLHKASHGLIEVIREAIGMLQRSGSQCLWLATSRPGSLEPNFDRRESWHLAFGALCSVAQRVIELEKPSEDDARRFLAASVRGFAAPMAGRVISQVGCEPFGLREALLYMRITGIVGSDEELDELVLRRPEDLNMRLETDEFRAATHHRLRLLRASQGPWLGRLLDVAACLGKRFDLELCSRSADVPREHATLRVLETCRREGVIRPSFTDSGAYQFDHDLVRVATLRSMAVADRMGIADRLLRDEGDHLDLRTRTLLTYLTARAAAFIDQAGDYADERAVHHRYVDAVEALMLAVLVADPAPYDVRECRSAAAGFDDAAAEADLPQLEPPMPEPLLIDLISKTLALMGRVTSGSSATEERLITHAELLARKHGEEGRQAVLVMRRGAMLLERGDVQKAYEAHQSSEAMFERLSPEERDRRYGERRRNAVHMAIACRHTNRKAESLRILTDLLATAGPDEYALRADCLADLGALDFYDNPQACRESWAAAASLCSSENNAPGEVHMLLDLADLDIAERLDSAAAQKVRRARDRATELELDNELLRAHVFSAVLALAASDHESADAHLVDALERGLSRSIGRRLWKIWANLATAAEASGDLDEAYINDERSTRALPIPSMVIEQRLVLEQWPDARVAVALGNISLRARYSPRHQLLLARQPDVLRSAADRMASAADNAMPSKLVARLSGYLREVCGRTRFLST